MAKNQSIKATQRRIRSLRWAPSLSSMADAQRDIYFPISCKGVCSQARVEGSELSQALGLSVCAVVRIASGKFHNQVVQVRLFFFSFFFSVYHYTLVRPCWAHIKAASKMNEWRDQSVVRASNRVWTCWKYWRYFLNCGSLADLFHWLKLVCCWIRMGVCIALDSDSILS